MLKKLKTLPLLQFSTGWCVKASILPEEHACLFFYSKYTGQVIMRFFSVENEEEIAPFVQNIVTKSGRKIIPQSEGSNEQ